MIRKIECENCHGVGTELCPKCNGNETDANGNPCSYCGGAGVSICRKCDGSGTIEVEVDDTWASMGW